jgi:metal-dependent amidase/aminoacylase/carboxypeptidase family protein
VRCLHPEDREKMEGRVRRVVEDTASAFGATAELNWDTATLSRSTTRTRPTGPWRPRAPWPMTWTRRHPIMPSEDFSYMLNERPGAYLFLGNGDSAMCHHPKYNFNDEAIPYGCSFFAEIVERRMPASQ